VSSFGFTLLTVIISFRLIFQHLGDWRYGHIQKYCVRIIFLLPIYAIESWTALYVRQYSMYLETARETYEAYAMWNFLSFVVALLGDEHKLLQILNAPSKRGRGDHVGPCYFALNPWTPQQILRICKLGVLQYVVIKNLTAISACILESYGLYHEGSFSPTHGWIFLTVMNNYSQTWALYCLVKFYTALKEEMHDQLGKFIAVKLVVFVTWWQSLLLNVVATHTNLLPRLLELSRRDPGNEGSRFNHQQFHSSELYNWWTEEEIATGMQNFLICLEMFLASIFFSYYFGVADIVRDSKISVDGNGASSGEGGRRGRANNHHDDDDDGDGDDDDDDDSGIDLEMATLLKKDIHVGPHSTLAAGPTSSKRSGAGRVQRAAAAFVQSSLPSDLISDFQDAGRDLVYQFRNSSNNSSNNNITGGGDGGESGAGNDDGDDKK
jgi:hypothetical protein